MDPDRGSRGSARAFGINATSCCDAFWEFFRTDDVGVANAAADWLRRLEGAGPPGEPPGPLHGVRAKEKGRGHEGDVFGSHKEQVQEKSGI